MATSRQPWSWKSSFFSSLLLGKDRGSRPRSGGCLLFFFLALLLGLGFLALQFSLLQKERRQAQTLSQSRVKANEARQNLTLLYQLQQEYYRETGSFAGGERCFFYLNWRPRSAPRYTYYCGAEVYPCERCDQPCPWSGHSQVDEKGFTLSAVGDLNPDQTCDYWTINEQGALTHERLRAPAEESAESATP